MLTVDEHKAMLDMLMRDEHEGYIAEVKDRAQNAEAEGRLDAARFHWDHVAELEAMEKPWEPTKAAEGSPGTQSG